MDLQEDAVRAGGHSGLGQDRCKFPLPAGMGSRASRKLHGVGGVEDHRVAEPLHYGDRPHVGDQIVVSEGGAAFGDEEMPVSGGGQFGHDVFHIPGGQKLPLFHVYRLAGAARGQEEIGLPAEERRDLEDIQNRRGRLDLPRLMDIGENRNLKVGFDPLQDRQAVGEPRSPKRGEGAAVGLVEGSLEDERHLVLPGQFPKMGGNGKGGIFIFDHAGACNEQEGGIFPDGHLPYVDAAFHKQKCTPRGAKSQETKNTP